MKLTEKNIKYCALIITFLIFVGTVQSQTKFRERVIVKGTGFPESGALESNQEPSSKTKPQLYSIVSKTVNDTLKVEKNTKLKSTKEKTLGGVKFEALKSVLTKSDTLIIREKKIKDKKKLYLEKGNHWANISVSKDSLLFNFWLIKNYYNDENIRKESPYHPNIKYFTTLKNRQHASFVFANTEVAALTIPFKYHFGYEKNNIEIDPDFTTNVNISAFLGRRIGKVRYTYDKYKGMIENRFSVTGGLFLGLGAQKIDSLSTTISPVPLTKERNIPVLSYGVGAIFNIKDFNLGLFLGLDKGLGKTARKWNYHDRAWLGFGLGYKVAILGKED